MMFLMVMVLILKLCCLFAGLLDFAFVYVKQQWFNVYYLKAIMNDFLIWGAAFLIGGMLEKKNLSPFSKMCIYMIK